MQLVSYDSLLVRNVMWINFSTCLLSYELECSFRTVQDTERIDHLIQFLDVPTYNKGIKTSYTFDVSKNEEVNSQLETNKWKLTITLMIILKSKIKMNKVN